MTGAPPLRLGLLGASRVAVYAVVEPARTNPDVAIIAVAARDPARAAAFAREHGIPRAHADYAALLADERIEAVHIGLPNSAHAEWATRAVRAGKHVLCEKPIAANAEEAARLAEAARGTGLVVAEAFHYRHHPLAHRVQAIVRSGVLGAIEHIEACYEETIRADDPVRWSYALAGGATMDLGCYPLQMLRWLGNGEPEVAHATAVVGPPDIDTSMTATLRLPGGASAEMRCGMDGVPLRCTLLIRGARGELTVDNPVAPHFGHALRITRDGTIEVERVPGEATYAHQLRDFVAGVRGGASMPVGVEDAVANMRLIDAVYRAAGLPLRGLPFAPARMPTIER